MTVTHIAAYFAVEIAVGIAVGVAVGIAVGSAVRMPGEFAVGMAVEFAVVFAVELAEEFAVELAEGSAVDFGGQYIRYHNSLNQFYYCVNMTTAAKTHEIIYFQRHAMVPGDSKNITIQTA